MGGGVLGSNHCKSSMLTIVFLMSSSMSIIGQLRPRPRMLPQELLLILGSSDLGTKLRTDKSSVSDVSADFGMLTDDDDNDVDVGDDENEYNRLPPVAVLRPTSTSDIASLVRSSYESPRSFSIAPRGHGHSIWGQASAPDGVVVEMRALGEVGGRISVAVDRGGDGGSPYYVDAGGEQLWVDILHETLKYGLAPRSWTDYLHLTVGGTLSNAGISGQAFRHGPQISNVLELDVITGRGDTVTCSNDLNSDLFHGVLGGLGQFGIITRARIPLDHAPQWVRWVRLIYTKFEDFTRDQEYLISVDSNTKGMRRGFDYVEGSLFIGQSPINSWRSSFFSGVDLDRINTLATAKGGGERDGGGLYFIEGSMYYDDLHTVDMDKDLELLLRDLRYEPGFLFTNDVSYLSFLERVHNGERNLRSKGLWDVPHPWLNIFVPKSRISDFDVGVFKGILNHHHESMGPILIFPLNATKWDERTSAVIPEAEEIFYSVALLRSAINKDWRLLDDENKQILRFCEQQEIWIKQYLPHYRTRFDWVRHFGSKWKVFLERKTKYDPKGILSPGQRIFNLLPHAGYDAVL